MFKKTKIVELLRNHVVDVTFTKVNGEIRNMECTLMESVIPDSVSTSSTVKADNPNVVVAWDLEKNGWRSFRVDSVIEYHAIDDMEAVYEKIEEWTFLKGFNDLMIFTSSFWEWEGDSIFKMVVDTDKITYTLQDSEDSLFNKDLIDSLRYNEDQFWDMCWVSSNRDGKHVFEVPTEF